MKIGVFTNEAYDILGVIHNKILLGFVIKTKYPRVYRKFQFVELPEYHLERDIEPQFILKRRNK